MSEALGIVGYAMAQQSLVSQGNLIHAESYNADMSAGISWGINCGEFSYAIVWVSSLGSSNNASILNMLVTPNMSNTPLYSAHVSNGTLVPYAAFTCTSTTSTITLISRNWLGAPRICVYK